MRRDRADERGAVTLSMLLLAVMLLSLGGLSVDLWHVLAERRALVAAADAAAYAAAGRIDEAAYRATGVIVLDPDGSRRAAAEVLAASALGDVLDAAQVEVVPDAASVTLTAHATTTLLRLLDPRLATLEIRVSSTAVPEVRS